VGDCRPPISLQMVARAHMHAYDVAIQDLSLVQDPLFGREPLSPRVVLGGERLPDTAVPAVGTTTWTAPTNRFRVSCLGKGFSQLFSGGLSTVVSPVSGAAYLLRSGAMLPAGCGWCVQRWQRIDPRERNPD
jgi:hypothetical protein